jgi:hypothetical protein
MPILRIIVADEQERLGTDQADPEVLGHWKRGKGERTNTA